NKTINFVGKDPIIGPPKTNNSYRILGMSNTVFNILKMVQQEQYINPNIVFSTPLGDYIHRNNINKRLNAVKKGTDYEYITVHFLRHANATLLIMNDVDIKVVSSHLGHNDIQTTANIYADVLKSKEHQIAQLIEFNLEDDQ
ncbi:tyrosine-type recombinase/integrase, partial [uncultured Catenibacterium sp.]|uniref:tyrosine-type recombinase/integrase n=1 Tax=uncultured Catenibacterium sp. TaxID=286142 RepID=UPI0025954E49